MRSTEPSERPARSPAACTAAASEGSAGIAENRGGDLPPVAAHDFARCAAALREKDTPHIARKERIGEDLFKIVDEMRASECRNPGDLVLAVILEIEAVGRHGLKKTLRAHPIARRLAQIDSRRVVMAKACLVADDKGDDPLAGAAKQKFARPGKWHGAANPGAINITLEALPDRLTVG